MSVRVLEVMGHSTGGIARHVGHVLEGLDRSEDLHIDVAAPPDLRVALRKPIFPVEIPDGLRGHASAVSTLRRLLRAGSYEVVHAHGLRAAIDCGLAARGARTGRGLGVVALCTFHNLVLAEVSGAYRAALYRKAEPLAVHLSRRVLAPSEDIARHLGRLVPGAAGKIEVLHLGVGEPPAPTRARADVGRSLDLGEGDRLVVTVARLAPQKALHVLLEALARLGPEVVLAVVGEGPLGNELEERAAELGVSERVRWLGYRADATDIVAAADVFCLASVWEACSLAAQEAIQLRIPVVSTDVGGMPELITDRVSGRLVPEGDVAGLATALASILDHPSRAAACAERAAEALATNFSTEAMLGRLEDIYLSEPRYA